MGRRVGGLVHRGSERARDMSQALKAVHPSMTLWIGAALLSAINWLLDTAALVLSFLAIGGRVPWSVALLAFAVAKVLSSFGITPGGIGVVEGGLVGTFAAYGTKTSTAVAGVILYRAITLIGLVGLGWGVAAVLAAEGHAQDAG